MSCTSGHIERRQKVAKSAIAPPSCARAAEKVGARRAATGYRRQDVRRAIDPPCTYLAVFRFYRAGAPRANGVFSNAVGLSTLLASAQLLAGLSIELTSA